MKYSIIGVAALLASACALTNQSKAPAGVLQGAGTTPAAAAGPKTPAAQVELVRLGVRARGPCPLAEFASPTGDKDVYFEGAGCRFDGQEFSVTRYLRYGKNRAADQKLFELSRKSFKTLARDAQLTLGEFRGVELEGTTPKGANMWERVFAVGDGFLIAQVSSVKGPIGRREAQGFFDSLEYAVPWSVHSFPNARLSVLFPDGGIRLDRQALHADTFVLAEASVLGGVEERSFAVYAAPLQGDADPETRFEAGSEAMIREGSRVVWQGPLSLEGVRGREYLMQSKSMWTRIRMLLSDTDLYMLQASALNKSALLDESVARFFDSLRFYPAR